MSTNSLKIIPLGGLDEIAKNMTIFEYDDTIIILDCGMGFPSEEMYGIDIVIPDITYLQRNKSKIKAIFLTHGHEDHIGSIPYVIREFNVPIYGSKLTIEILKNKLKEHRILATTSLNVLDPGQTKKISQFTLEFIASNHSIADSVMVAIHTPLGTLLHTGDFKIDCTPINGQMIDLARIGELGKNGVLVLMSDSTNAERPGFAMSEREVGDKFDRIFESALGKRIFVATFASNIHRVQQIINSAIKYNRKIAVSGKSMLTILTCAIKLGYMDIPENALIDIGEISNYDKGRLVIITTGSQGEPMSALTRMAMSEHKKVTLDSSDLVIISASPIPGNERSVSNVINELYKRGASVIYDSIEKIHVSGHACQEELKIILGLAKPKYFIPVHGEYRHLIHHKNVAELMGVKPTSIFVMKIGDVLSITQNEAKMLERVPSGNVFVDGLGVGDVGSIVLKDRKHLSQDGLIAVVIAFDKINKMIVSGPDVISRGFVYVRESELLMKEIRKNVKHSISEYENKNLIDWTNLKSTIKTSLSDFLFSKTKRRPMILTIVIEV